MKGEDAGIGGDDSSKKSVSEKFVLTVLEFNDAPVASALKDHLLTDAVVEDTEITYKFDAFEDEETSPLAYSYTVVRIEDDDSKTDVSPLWIDFVATTRTFTFKPDKSWHAGTYEVTVKGEDAGIPGKPKKSISAEFELEVKAVNDPPVAPFSEEVRKGVEEGGTMTYRVPAFTDEENDRAVAPLAYSYTVVRVAPNGDDTPVSVSEIRQWVKFDDKPLDDLGNLNPTFREFTFTPSESRHKGEYRVRVFAQDTSGLETSVQFMLTVGEFNDKPVASTLVGRTVVEDTPSTYVFDAFTDEETSALTYTALWAAEGTESTAGEKVFVDLPDDGWIAFGAVDGDATKMQFAFKPHKSWHTGKHTLRVVGTDAGIGGDPDTKKSDFAEFVLEVVDFNDAPVASSLAAHTVQEDVDEAHASVTYPVSAFTDEETSALTYSYTIVRVEKNGDETAVSVSDWVDFDDDASSPTFTFTPHRSWHAGKYKVRVKGEDAGIGGDPDTKKSAIAEFMLTVGEYNDAPVASSPKDHRLADAVVEDTPSIYVFDAFTDEEEDKASRSLSYTSFWAARDSAGRDIVDVDGEKTFVPHATWIEFGAVDGDATKLQFRFKPDRSWDAGKYTLRVVGTDEGIPDAPAAKSAIAEFVLEVLDFNDAPVASTLVDQKVAEDTTASYRFDAFTDEEEDKVSRSLLYTAFWAEKDSAGNDIVDADGKQTFVSLPTWIVFDGLKRRFTFEPDKSWHAGKHTLRVVGTEKGISGKPTPKSAFAEFVLDVEEVNDAPVASTPTEQKVVEDTTSTYRFDVFTDEEDDAAGVPLTYRAFWASKDGDGEDVVDGAGEKVFVPLPAWIPFDRETRTFTFRPKEDSHAGVHTLRVVGEDAGIGTDAATKKRSHADFVLRVESVNDAPVASTLVDQKVAEDVGSTYVFDAFEDEETPSSALTYSAHLLIFPSSSAEEVFFEGSPASEETSSGEERSSGSEGSVRSRRDSSARAEVSLPDWISFDGGRRLFRFSPETGAHVGRHALRVRGRDASGKTETADFALRVSATNDAPKADVSIEGSLEEGRVVHLRVAGLSDEDGVPSSSKSHRYRWYESSEPEVQSSWSLISGAESASFRLGSGQAGKYLRGVFSYMDSGGTRERVFAQSEEVVRRKSLPSVVVPIFGGEKESSSSSVSVSEEGEALEMVSRSLSQAQERLSLMRNRRGSGSGVPSLPPPRFSLPPVLSEPRVQPPSSQGSGVQAPQSPQAQGTTTQQSGGASSQPSSQPPGSQGGGAQIPQSPQAQGTSAQQGDGASSQPSSQPRGSQGSGTQVPQSPQPQGTSARQSDGASSQPSSQPPGSQGSGAQVPQSPQAQGTSAQQSGGASSQPSSQPPTSQGSGAQVPQSPQAQGTSAQQSGGASSQPSSQPPTSQGSGAQAPQSPQAQGTSAQQSDGCTVSAAGVVGYPLAVWRSRTAESPRRAECRRADPTCARSRRAGRCRGCGKTGSRRRCTRAGRGS